MKKNFFDYVLANNMQEKCKLCNELRLFLHCDDSHEFIYDFSYDYNEKNFVELYGRQSYERCSKLSDFWCGGLNFYDNIENKNICTYNKIFSVNEEKLNALILDYESTLYEYLMIHDLTNVCNIFNGLFDIKSYYEDNFISNKLVTNFGQTLYFTKIEDCDENVGGYYVEIYLNDNYDEKIDDLVIYAEHIKGFSDKQINDLIIETLKSFDYRVDLLNILERTFFRKRFTKSEIKKEIDDFLGIDVEILEDEKDYDDCSDYSFTIPCGCVDMTLYYLPTREYVNGENKLYITELCFENVF